MSGKLHNLSSYDSSVLPSAIKLRIAILVSEWNPEITSSLLAGALQVLHNQGASNENIVVHWVPGSFELPLAANIILDKDNFDAVICLGCVIQGETRHFDFICQAVAKGVTDVSLKFNIPVIFGVLTTNNYDQARERAGGTHGNKGIEAAVAALKMATLKNDLET